MTGALSWTLLEEVSGLSNSVADGEVARCSIPPQTHLNSELRATRRPLWLPIFLVISVFIMCKTVSTMTIWVRFAAVSVRTWSFRREIVLNSFQQRWVTRWSVTVHITSVSLQIPRCAKTFVTQWTPKWFFSCVDSHVTA